MFDNRFKDIKNCTVCGLYKKLPQSFGGFLIEIRFKENKNDLFSITKFITIDQSILIKELSDWFNNGENGRLCYTDGMGDIDIFMRGKEYVIYYSPNDSNYQYYHFTSDEFKKLRNWVKMEITKD
jgi:trehalose utilization protein